MGKPIIRRACADINAFRAHARRFAGNVQGATAIEYALIAALIFMATVGSIRLYSSKMDGVYGRISTTISQVD